MSVYLDASLLVSLFATDANSARAEVFARQKNPVLFVSDFAAAEFISAIGRLRRTGQLTLSEAGEVLTNFDAWRATSAVAAAVQSSDVAAADGLLRRFDLVLRAPDGINLAIAQRLACDLATFDARMADVARAIGIPVVAI